MLRSYAFSSTDRVHTPFARHSTPRCVCAAQPSDKRGRSGAVTNVIEHVHNLFISLPAKGAVTDWDSVNAEAEALQQHGAGVWAGTGRQQNPGPQGAGDVPPVPPTQPPERLSRQIEEAEQQQRRGASVKAAGPEDPAPASQANVSEVHLQDAVEILQYKVEQLTAEVALHRAKGASKRDVLVGASMVTAAVLLCEVRGLEQAAPVAQVAPLAAQVNPLAAAWGQWTLGSRLKEGELFASEAHVCCVAMTPDFRRVLWGGDSGNLQVYSLESGVPLGLLSGHSDTITSVAVTTDGRSAVTASNDRDLRIWDLEAQRCTGILQAHTDAVMSVALTPDGQRVLSGGYDDTVRVWSLADRTCLATLTGHRSSIRGVACTPDGRQALSVGWDSKLHRWSLESYGSTGVLRLREPRSTWDVMKAVAVTPDGRFAVVGSNDAALYVWDLRSCMHVASLRHGSQGAVYAVAVTPDGRYALCGGNDGQLHVWDLESHTHVDVLKGHTAAVRCVAVAPGGQWALSGGEDGAVRAWSLGARLPPR